MSREGTPPVSDLQLVVGRGRHDPATSYRLYSAEYQVHFPPMDQHAYHCIPRIEPPGNIPAGRYSIRYEDKAGQPVPRPDGGPDLQIEIGEQQQVVSSPVDHATYEERKWQQTARREASNLRRASFVTENKRLVETLASREQSMAATLSSMMQMVQQQTQLVAKQTELQGQSQRELLEQTARLIKEATTNLHAPTPPPPPADYANVLNNLITAATTVVTAGIKESSRARRRLNSILIGEELDRGSRAKKNTQQTPTLEAAKAAKDSTAPAIKAAEPAPKAEATSDAPSAAPAASAASAAPSAPATQPIAPAPSAPAAQAVPAAPPTPALVPEPAGPASPAAPASPEAAASQPSESRQPLEKHAPAQEETAASPTAPNTAQREALEPSAELAPARKRPKWSQAKAWYEVKRRFFSLSDGTILWLIGHPRYLLHFVESLVEILQPPQAGTVPC